MEIVPGLTMLALLTLFTFGDERPMFRGLLYAGGEGLANTLLKVELPGLDTMAYKSLDTGCL